MSEFTPIEQAMLTQGLSDQQKMLFSSQYDSSKKDPGTMLVLSVLLGSVGVDRFMLGDTGMGLLKLFTFGLCGVLTIIDWFTVKSKTNEYNRAKANEILSAIKLTSYTPPSQTADTQRTAAVEAPSGSFCIECGAALSANAKFCNKCGTGQASS